MAAPAVQRFSGAEALAAGAAREIAARIGRLIAERGRCRLALAGGGTPRPSYSRLAGEAGRAIDWSRVDVFWGDERCVAPDDESSNYRMAAEALLSRVQIPPANIHRIHGELGPEEAARAYAGVLGDQPLDLVILGLGEDGHTASLFPGSAALEDRESRVLATRSPVPPVDRVSLGLRALDEAGAILFLVAGDSKAEPLAEVLRSIERDSPILPAARVKPVSGDLTWFVDAAAAARLPT